MTNVIAKQKKQAQMKMLQRGTMINVVAKHNDNGKLGDEAQEQGQIRLLNTRTKTNEVAKQKNKDK